MSEPAVRPAHCGGRRHGVNGTVHHVVIHDEEFPLSVDSAEKIGAYFAKPDHGAACAHYVEDSNSEVHVAADSELCYHAPPNGHSVGIERDGYASWTLAQWNQPDAQRTTCRVAARTAELLVRHRLPAVWCTATDLLNGRYGVTDHRSRSAAFGQSTHTDPGPAFPREAFMALVLTAYSWCATEAAVREFQEAHSSPTGPLDVDGDVGPLTLGAMALALFTGNPGGPAAPGQVTPPPPAYTAEPATGELRQWMKGPRVQQMQSALGVLPDGYFGIDTGAALRQFQAAHGLAVTGRGDTATMRELLPAPRPPAPPKKDHYGPQIKADGDLGPKTYARLQSFLRVKPADGKFGPISKRALQRWLGVRADGVIGPITVRALQRRLGVRVDGRWGDRTTLALQTYLNHQP